MLIGWGNYELSTDVTGGSGTGQAFITDPSLVTDGRIGTGAIVAWTNGTQNTSSYVELTVTISSRFEASARQGIAGIYIQGLPAGTKVVMGGITQRLVVVDMSVDDEVPDQLAAWVLPFANSNTMAIRIYNDVNGTSPITPGFEFLINEAFVGRVNDICTLMNSSPGTDLTDPTGFSRTAGNQLWELMRNPYRTVTATMGTFTATQAKGGAASNISDGGIGTIDIQSLRAFIAKSRVIAICDMAAPGLGDFSESNGIRYDQDFMQTNWMLARPQSAGPLVMNRAPYYTWSPTFQQAT